MIRPAPTRTGSLAGFAPPAAALIAGLVEDAATLDAPILPVRDGPEAQRLTADLLMGARSDETRKALEDAIDHLDEVFERRDEFFSLQS